MGNFFVHNGRLMPAGHEIQDRANRSCRYNDGLFETMRIHHDGILFQNYHFDRLAGGMEALKIGMPTGFTLALIKDLTQELSMLNGHQPAARVRLMVFRGELNAQGHHQTDFIIESWQLDPIYTFPEGLHADIYPGAYKNAGSTAAYKTNYELYLMAAGYAQAHQLDECLLFNNAANICDASIANIFWIKDGEIATPPLSEGCIAGVMRRYLLTTLQQKGYPVVEKALTLEALLNADEAFLTNVIRGIRPVRKFQQATYGDMLTKKIFTELITPLTAS